MAEVHSSAADRIRDLPDERWVSDLTITEFAIAMNRRRRRETLSPEAYERVMSTFEGHLRARFFRRHPIEPRNFDRAGELARETDRELRSLDALHLTVLEGLGADLVTFDQRLRQASESLGLVVRDLGSNAVESERSPKNG